MLFTAGGTGVDVGVGVWPEYTVLLTHSLLFCVLFGVLVIELSSVIILEVDSNSTGPILGDVRVFTSPVPPLLLFPVKCSLAPIPTDISDDNSE